jgi:elongator complex protein 3
VDKAELIVMGGTMTARPPGYQEWFVSECLRAMNDHGGPPSVGGAPFDAIARENERSPVRCVAITFETRPDWCREEHVERMLALGVTKVELGVQHTEDRILDLNRRGCRFADAVEANRLLRDSGFKVGFHVMPNLPGASLEDDGAMFSALFADERLRPDFLKIYPTLVTPGSGIEALHREGGYEPYPEPVLVDLIARAKALIPPYVRLQRVQRDIPAKLITAGSIHGNLRQMARARLGELGGSCRCIRCREAGRRPPGGPPVLEVLPYPSCGGMEYFVSAVAGDALIGYARLRFPGTPGAALPGDTSLVRELHVYGSLVRLGKGAGPAEWQHRSFGALLLERAEEISLSGGFRRMAVLPGIGVRPYYRKRGYEGCGPYLIKELA